MDHKRHIAAGALALLSLSAVALAASPAVRINEFHYHQEDKTEPVEFIELYNTSIEPVDLSDWAFTRGIRFNFPHGATIEPEGYVVVAQDPAALKARFGVDSLGPWEGRLSNQGERILLVDARGNAVDEIRYQPGFPWPTVGEDPAYSIELVNPAFDSSLAGNWRRSLNENSSAPVTAGPTPGARNSVFAENIGPQIRDVAHTPREPRSAEPVRITATITDPDGVDSVFLHYQLVEPGNYIEITDPEYTTQWTTLPMNDAGEIGDLVAGDNIFSVELPASIQQHRRLVRYRITANDSAGYTVTVPYPDDPQPNFAYFVYDGVPAWRGAIEPGVSPEFEVSSEEMGRLPTFHLISKRTAVENSTWFERYRGSDYKWHGALVYDGRVYDHIRYRARGGVWRYAMVKNMWKFRFNRGHELQAHDNWGNQFKTTWRRLNLGASIQQGNFNHRGEQGMFESLGFRLFNLAGVEGPHTTFATFRVIADSQESDPGTQYEGDFWGVYLVVEQPDGRMLDEHGLPEGNLYKMEGGTGELNHLSPYGPSDKSDLNQFLAGYNNATDAWWRSNFDREKYYSYQAVAQGIHHYDICYDKNFFYFRDPFTGIWSVHPWDLDLTWAENMFDANCGGVDRIKARLLNGSRPAFELEYRNRVREIRDLLFNEDQGWQLIEEYARLLQGDNAGPTLLDADRAMWDYNPKMTSSIYSTNPQSKAGTGRFYKWPPPYSQDFNGVVQLMKDYMVFRSTTTTGRDPSLDSIAHDPAIPDTPAILYLGPEEFPANRLQFQAQPYSGVNPLAAIQWRIGEITRTDSPDYDPAQPHQYEIDALWESAASLDVIIHIPSGTVQSGAFYRVRARVKDSSGRWSHWSPPIEFMATEPDNHGALIDHLLVTELMYDAPGGSDYDFIELYNDNPTRTLDLSGMTFTDGVTFTVPDGISLAPETYLVVVKTSPENDFGAFRFHYGLDNEVVITGPYTGNFRRSGERVELQTATGEMIWQFTYSPDRGWPLEAAGAGHSLVPLERTYRRQARALDYGGNWRASTYIGGSPGRADPEPPDGIRLSEFMANTQYFDPENPAHDSNDWIELSNPTAEPIYLEGYYLSDRADNLQRWAIPSVTLLPAGRVVFDEITGFNTPPGSGFALSSAGEELFLSYLPGTGEDRVVDAVGFMAQEPGISLGRHPAGGSYWHPMPPTPDESNAQPLLSIVINELMYNPPRAPGQDDNTLDEFVELWNPTDQDITLTESAGTWRIADGIRFDFPPGTTIPAGGYLLLVNFDPDEAALLDAFRAQYRISAEVPILGPYGGNLSNSGERISLEKPQSSDNPEEPVVWVLVDEVIYFDRAPWPRPPDGDGPSLQRILASWSGNDPTNWAAGDPTPGGSRHGEGSVPEPPASLTAGSGFGGVTLTWTPSTGATGYSLFRSTTSGGPYSGIAAALTTTSYIDHNVTVGTTYYYVVSAVNDAGESEFSIEVSASPASGEGAILREWWLGISGTAVFELTSNPNYPANPSGSELITRFEGPTNWADHYGTRVRGYVHPPAAGDYTFWIAGDDNCELWLSTDDKPANAIIIARVPVWTNPREWTRFPEQQSSPVHLNAGQRYYIEALHKEGTGGDNLAVAWQGPTLPQQVIDGIHLSAWTGIVPPPPSGLQAVPGNNAIVLTWNSRPTATGYNLKRSTTSGGPYTVIAAGFAGTTYTDEDVSIGTTYYYVVSAILSGEETADSSQASASPAGDSGRSNFSTAVLAADPTAYWRFNESPGNTTAFDQTGQFHGTYGQGVTLGAPGPQPPDFTVFESSNSAARFEVGRSASFVTIPALGVSMNTMTMTAWIRPMASIAWSGIVFYRQEGGSASGLNLREGGSLGYHWNDSVATWSWESGLFPPLDQWSFVALVIEPSQATIHRVNLAGMESAVNPFSHQPRLFDGPMRIGNDPWGSGRTFTGEIDEVALFNYALTPQEVYDLYLAEVEVAPATLSIHANGDGTITITWDEPGRLQSTSTLQGAATRWKDEETTGNSQTVGPADAARFYRIVQ